MSTCILTTTIHVPALLRDYALNAREFGHANVEFVVVGDLKTPPETGNRCAAWELETGCEFTFLDTERQVDYLGRFPRLGQLIPWNSHQRRNVGLLHAIERGHEFIVTIDDDNFLLPGCDFIGEHTAGLGRTGLAETVRTAHGWFNCISMMRSNHAPVYPRGFPLSQRWQEERAACTVDNVRPVVNAGLWAGDPDIDALTRLYRPVETDLPLSHDYLVLGPRCWCPVNTQNTALHRSAAPAAFMVIMGHEFAGLRISRYCDIWMSWLLRTVIDRMGDAVRFGHPVVRQDRNAHNLFKDLRDELPGMELNETLIEACQAASLRGSTYLSAYAELAQHLRAALGGHPERQFFGYLADQMEIWAEAVDSLSVPAVQARAA